MEDYKKYLTPKVLDIFANAIYSSDNYTALYCASVHGGGSEDNSKCPDCNLQMSFCSKTIEIARLLADRNVQLKIVPRLDNPNYPECKYYDKYMNRYEKGFIEENRIL